MEQEIKASIIIRAYNSEKTIGRALQSALAQDFQYRHEVLVINDGSTDGTSEIVQQHSDPRIRLFDQENKGIVEAANRGFREARAELVVLLDSDDEALPTFLKDATAPLITDPSVDYSYPDYFEEYKGAQKRIETKDPFFAIAGGMVWRRKKFLEEGGFQGGTIFPEYDILLRTWGRWKGVRVTEPVLIYHRRAESLASNEASVQASIADLLKKYPERHEEISRIRSYVIPK